MLVEEIVSLTRKYHLKDGEGKGGRGIWLKKKSIKVNYINVEILMMIFFTTQQFLRIHDDLCQNKTFDSDWLHLGLNPQRIIIWF